MCGCCPRLESARTRSEPPDPIHSCASLSSVASLLCFQRGKTGSNCHPEGGSGVQWKPQKLFCLSRVTERPRTLCSRITEQGAFRWAWPEAALFGTEFVCLKGYTWKGLVSEVSGGCRCIFSSALALSGHMLSHTLSLPPTCLL